jgi:hypothetical protein
MRIFSFFQKAGFADRTRLIGCWHIIRVEGPDSPDDVELDFRPDGQLFSATKTGDKWEVLRLSYHMRRSVIVSSGNIRTGFMFEPDGTLRLDAEDSCTWYERGSKRAPEPE